MGGVRDVKGYKALVDFEFQNVESWKIRKNETYDIAVIQRE